MAFEPKLRMLQQQRMVMTPMLQQAIRLLTLTRMDLIQEVRTQLDTNPVLEELPEGADAPEETPEATPEPEAAPEPADGQDPVAEFDWDSYLESASDYRPPPAREQIERLDLETNLTRGLSLQEHLEFQLYLSTSDPKLREWGSLIIGNLDDRGYLKEPLDEFATSSGVPVTGLEEALCLVQTFDPTGVGARDLRECLLLQLDALPEPPSLARTIVAEHLGALEGQPLMRLAERLGVSVQEVQVALEVIRRLEPKPGGTFGTEDPRYITPDVYIVKVDDRFIVMLNDEGLPRLRVSAHYRQILQARSGVPREVREYVEGRMRSGLWLIRSIEQRQRTLYRVTDSLVRFQRDFLEKGIMALRPLTLKEVAEDIGVHESTVSRVTTNKYVHTPQGLFELKYFFHRGIPVTTGSETASSLTVKELVRQLLSQEDTGKPMSDRRVVEILRAQHNIEIARRTVAKYRGQLKILSSSRRKRY
jgi:RNA polymerase sigma-54 factor